MEVYTGQPQDAPFDNIYQTKNYILFDLELSSRASLVVQSVKSLPAMGDLGLTPGSGRFSGEGNGKPPQYSCLENPWREEPGRLQSMGSQRVGHD